MKTYSLVFVHFLAFIFVNSQGVQEAFERHEIVPDILDQAPVVRMEVIYPGGLVVELGNELLPSQAQVAPIVGWEADPTTLYTFTMVDPDYPDRDQHIYRSIKHWLIGNVMGSDISTGDQLADYVGLRPPENSGIHRYVFLVYQQPGRINFSEGDFRYNFSVMDFSAEYNLGQPIFGNFYTGQYDPTLNVTYN